jgi:hypothetical protein
MVNQKESKRMKLKEKLKKLKEHLKRVFKFFLSNKSMPDAIEVFKRGFDWIKDKEFLKVFLTLWAVNFIFQLLIMAAVIILIFVVGDEKTFSSMLVEETSTLILALLTNPYVIITILFVIIGLIVVQYINGFYLTAKIFEKYGKITKYLKINISNIIDMIVYGIVSFITIDICNWMDKRIAIVQGVLLIIGVAIGIGTIAALLSGASESALILLLAMLLGGILILLPLLIIVAYNGIRYAIALPVRVAEAESARDAMVKTWSLTSGKALEIFVIIIIVVIFSTVLGLAGFIVKLPIQIVGGIYPIASLIASFSTLLIDTGITSFSIVVVEFVLVNYYLSLKTELAGKSARKSETERSERGK